jgi:imidazolonepropionase
VAECERIAQAARGMGYRLKVHADQMGPIGGAELAARLGAASADHLDYVSPAGIRALARSGTVGVLLPGVTHHMLEMTPKLVGRRLVPAVKAFWPRLARRLIDGGVRLALSADYNPGTSPTPSMQAVMQLAARLYRLSYAAIWHMATINAAHALDRGDDRGSLEPGKRADLVIWRVAEHGMVVNRFGVNLVDTVVKDGRVLVRDGVRVSG